LIRKLIIIIIYININLHFQDIITVEVLKKVK